MRAIHPELVRMLRKAPITGRARVIPEAIVPVNEDVRAFDTDWNNADSPTGLQVAPNGDLRLTGSFSTTVEHTNSDTYMTDLDRASPWSVAKVTWAGTLDRDFEIQQVKAYLHPKRTAAAKEVVWWKMILYRVHRVWPASVFIAQTLEIQAIGSAKRVAATGTAEAEYIFDFSGSDNGAKPKLERPIIMPGAMAIRPTTYIRILALKADGSAAGNVGFSADTATPSVTTSGVTLEQTTLTENAVGDGRGRWSEPDVPVDECPRLAIIAESYSDATVTFSVAGGGTIINLGAAPTKDLECVLVGRTPSDTAIVGEIRKAAPDAWTEFLDGDLIGVDNSLPGGTGGKDLSGLTPTQQTYEIRAQLKTNTALNTTPRLKQLGVRELTRISFDRLATVDVEWNVHPYEMRSEISRAVITSMRDGREDFNDQITELLVDYDVAEIAWRIMIGHPDLDRHKWLHIDTFPIAYDYDPRATEIECQWDSALTLLRAALPVASGSPLTRDILNYNATVGIETLKEVSDDLLDGQIGLAGKYRGQGITDDTTTIAKRIGERDPDMVVTALSDAKTEADAVAFIAGGAWGTDAGRVRFFDLFADDFVVMLFHEREITVESVSPGLALRTPEVFLAYDYDVQSRQYTLEHRGFHGVALTALGISNLGPPKRLSDTVGKWIDDTTLAETVVERHFNAFGMGVRLWRFRCIYPYPELQFGDRVIVPTKQFVMRDPIGSRELRGQLWVIGTIVGVHDALGTAFTLWVRSLSDILASSEAVTIELRKRLVARCYHSVATVSYSAGGTGSGSLAWDNEVFDPEGMHDNSTNNERFTVPTTGTYRIQGAIKYSNYAVTGSGYVLLEIKKNGATTLHYILNAGNTFPPAASGSLPYTALVDLTAGDYITLDIRCAVIVSGSAQMDIEGGAATDSTYEIAWEG